MSDKPFTIAVSNELAAALGDALPDVEARLVKVAADAEAWAADQDDTAQARWLGSALRRWGELQDASKAAMQPKRNRRIDRAKLVELLCETMLWETWSRCHGHAALRVARHLTTMDASPLRAFLATLDPTRLPAAVQFARELGAEIEAGMPSPRQPRELSPPISKRDACSIFSCEHYRQLRALGVARPGLIVPAVKRDGKVSRQSLHINLSACSEDERAEATAFFERRVDLKTRANSNQLERTGAHSDKNRK